MSVESIPNVAISLASYLTLYHWRANCRALQECDWLVVWFDYDWPVVLACCFYSIVCAHCYTHVAWWYWLGVHSVSTISSMQMN
jgi:hypothetical protein